MGTTTIIDMINQYGVPTVVAVGMAYFIYYVWKFVTHNILPSLGAASSTLVGLIDRVRMLDNDLIRLKTKLDMILQQQDKNDLLKQQIKKGWKLDKQNWILIKIKKLERIRKKYQN